MSYFAVTREAGAEWTDGEGAFAQPGLNDHANFMGGLESEGFVLFAGPLAGSEDARIRVLLIVDAASEDEIRGRLREDPWELTGRLATSTIEPWNLLVGAERMSAAHAVAGS